MGEIAEDHAEGRCCSDCGCYFAHPTKKDRIYDHGYPVICKDCWSEYTPKERRKCGMTRAQVNTI